MMATRTPLLCHRHQGMAILTTSPFLSLRGVAKQTGPRFLALGSEQAPQSHAPPRLPRLRLAMTMGEGTQ